MLHVDLHKRFDSKHGRVQIDAQFSLQQQQVIALFGESGVGKTTVLRMLAGLTAPDSGSIRVGDVLWYNSQERLHLKPQKRSIGFVFQGYSLFPNMSVRNNIAFAQTEKSDAAVNEMLAVMGLEALAQRKPTSLSGGQQQRVALARALIRKPELLLLDEPLSALDAEMRLKLQEEILRVTRLFNTTTIVVSHDIPEVFKLANTVVVMENGKVLQQGTPGEVFAGKATTGIELVGEVLAVEAGTIKVLVGHRIVTLPTENTYSIGDKVVINPALEQAAITKIKS